MTNLPLLLTLTLLMPHTSLAQTKAPSCGSFVQKALNCEELKKKSHWSFSDGTQMVNPLAQTPEPKVLGGPRPPVEKSPAPDFFDAQVLFSQELDALSTGRVSQAFKVSLLRLNAFDLEALFTSENQNLKNSTEPSKVPVAWPANDPKAKLSLVPPLQVYQLLKDLIPTDRLAEIAKLTTGTSHVDIPAMIETQVKVSDADKKRVQNLFLNTQEKLIQQISGGRRYVELSTAERSFVDRIKTIKMVGPGLSSPDSDCPLWTDNAFYSPATHSFEICPAMFRYPDSALTFVIAHEMAHSLDPCRSLFPLYKIDEQVFTQKSFNEGDSDQRWEFFDHFKMLSERSPYTIFDGELWSPSGQKTLKKAEDHYNLQTIAPALMPNEHPRLMTMACLRKMGFASTNSESVRHDIKMALKDLPAAIRTESEKRFEALFARYPECLELGHKSQLNEALSDTWGAQTLASYLKDHPPKSSDDQLAPFLFFVIGSCSDMASARKPIAKATSTADLVEELRQSLANHRSSDHGSELIRVEKILLANPDLSSIYGCTPGETAACFKKMPRSSPSEVPRSGSPQEGTK